MNFTSQDITLIERALKSAMTHEREENRVKEYKEVLLKLRESAQLVMDAPIQTVLEKEGIRYDYDDSSDLL